MKHINQSYNQKENFVIGMVISFLYVSYIFVRSWATLSLVPSILFILLTMILTWFYFIFAKNHHNIEHIAFLSFLVLYMQAVGYPGIAFSRGAFRTWYFAGPQIDLFWGLLVWIVGCSAFIIGLRAVGIPKKTIFDKLPSPEMMPVKITLVMMIISCIASILIVRQHGGFGNMLAGDVASDSIRLSRGLGAYSLFQSTSYIAVAYLGWQAYLNRRKRTRRTLLLVGVIWCLLGSVVQIIQARRGVLVYHFALLILPFGVDFLKRKRAFLLLYVIIVMFGDDITIIARESYYRTNRIDINAIIDEFRETNRPVPLSYDHLFLTAAIHSRIVAKQFDYKYGLTFVAGILNWLPRKLFPYKLWTAGPYLANAMTDEMGYSYDDLGRSSSMTTGIILESYMNFGIMGIPIILCLVGYTIGRINLKMHSAKADGFMLSLWSVLIIFMTNIFADTDLGGLTNKIIFLVFGLIILRIARRLFIKTNKGEANMRKVLAKCA